MYVTNISELHDPLAGNLITLPEQKLPTRQPVRATRTGRYLFHEGDDAAYVYEVITGVLRLTRVMENGRRQVIAFGYPGDIIGFPNEGCHNTECDAIACAEVIAHPSESLKNDQGDPELRQRLLQAALCEISAMQDHCMMLGRKSAREKIASFLSVLSGRVGVPIGAYTEVKLPMTRSDIADFLGLTTETISRTFSQFRAARIIALEDTKSVVVLRPDMLLALSEQK